MCIICKLKRNSPESQNPSNLLAPVLILNTFLYCIQTLTLPETFMQLDVSKNSTPHNKRKPIYNLGTCRCIVFYFHSICKSWIHFKILPVVNAPLDSGIFHWSWGNAREKHFLLACRVRSSHFHYPKTFLCGAQS